jgi:hypothetical protein
MAGKMEIRASGERFRFVVLNRSGEKLMQSGPFDDKAAAKRAASSLAKAVSGAEIIDATKPAARPKSTAPRSGTKR